MKLNYRVIFVLTLLAVEAASAVTLNVTSIADSGPGTLRDTLASAADGDTINATWIHGTIRLTSGELFVDKSVIITGPGPDKLALDGDLSSRVFHIAPDVVVNLAGLTITHGVAPAPDGYGGGIYNDHATLTVRKCVVIGNFGDNGAGIYNDAFSGSATLTLEQSIITDNQADSGGGVYNAGFYGTASLAATNCTITGNSSYEGGGLCNIGVGGDSPLTLVNSDISGNTAMNGSGGGIYIFINGSSNALLTVVNCTLSRNDAGQEGGGVENLVVGGSATLMFVDSTIKSNLAAVGGGIYNLDYGTVALTVSNCIISDNSASLEGYNPGLGGAGGGIVNESDDSIAMLTILDSKLIGNRGGGVENLGFIGSATLTISNCVMSDNSAPDSEGGAIYNLGGYSIGTGSVWIANSTLTRNTAAFGGGIANDVEQGNAILQIVNSTLDDNSASDSGGAIYNISTALTVVNDTFSDNLADNIGGGICNGGTMQLGSTILKTGASGATLANFATVTSLGYNLASDDAGGTLTNPTDMIDTDPMLGPLRNNGGLTFTRALLPGSPAIDQGKNFSGSPFDQRGHRFVRTFDNPFILNAPGGDSTDIGAFEMQTSSSKQAVQYLLTLVNSEMKRPQPLRAILDAALTSLGRNNPTAAIYQLAEFQRQVRVQVMPSDHAMAAELLQAAQNAINTLNAQRY